MQLLFARAGAAQGELPDVVETVDNGLVRGLIVEREPSGAILLRTATGEIRRYEAADIRYAGPASGAVPSPDARHAPPSAGDIPSADARHAPPSAGDIPNDPAPAYGEAGASERRRVDVRVVSPTPRLTLMLQTAQAFGSAGDVHVSAAQYEPICTAPCSAQLTRGSHVFAIRDQDGRMRPIRRPVYLVGDSELEIGIRSRRRARTIWGITSATLVAVGAGLLAFGATRPRDPFARTLDLHPGLVPMSVGGGLIFTGVFMGVFGLMFTKDQGQVDARPLAQE